MTKILKTTFTILITLTLLILIGVGVLVTFVSPNKFKPIITAQVLKYTGRQLTIGGDLGWTFYPYLGFKAEHVSLSNPPAFTQKIFAEMKEVKVGVKLLPLLHAKVETSAIALTGLKLNLIKNADGTTNWQDLQAGTAKTANTKVTKQEIPKRIQSSTTADADSTPTMSFNIPRIDISDSQINWSDAAKKQTARLNKFEFHSNDIHQEHAFPVHSTFEFTGQNPTISGQGSIDGQFKLNLSKKTYAITDLAITLQANQQGRVITLTSKSNVVADMMQQTVAIQQFSAHLTHFIGIDAPIDIQGEVTANLAQKNIKLNNFTGKIANLTLVGNVNVSDFKVAKGHLQAQPFDLKMLLQALGKDKDSLRTAKMVRADFDFSATTSTTAYSIQAVSLQGKIKIDQLNAARLTATNVVMQTQLQNGVLSLTSMTATFYQGNLQANAKINVAAATPQISLQAKLNNVQAEPLFQDLQKQGGKIKIKGAGNIDVQVTTAGLDTDTIIRNLNGSGNLSVNNGQLNGVNIGYLLDSGLAVIKRQAAPAQNENVTNFGNLTASGKINAGVLTNNDLLMNGPRFMTKGQGTINLVTQQINYSLQIIPTDSSASNNGLLNFANLTIPVRITGNLNNPTIGLDTGMLLQEVAKSQIQKVQTKITNQITNGLPVQAGKLLQNILGK